MQSRMSRRGRGLAPWCTPRSSWSLGPLGLDLAGSAGQHFVSNPRRSGLVRAMGGGGVCRQERYGEGKGLEITFLGFLQKTFAHPQLPCAA